MIARYLERKRAEDQLKVSLGEKEILLRELYHRTKNNMQIISSLLNLQSMAIDDKQMLHVIQEIQNRIRSLSLVHEKLFESKDLSNISLKDYIEDLAHALLTSYQGSNERISVTVDVENVLLSLDTITTCGLIINELVSNSLKYAFPDDEAGNIRISLHLTDKGEIGLRISDNGIGLPESLDFQNPQTLGLRLVRKLVEEQLRGRIELKGEKRTDFLVMFKEMTGYDRNIRL
jgi:two-component sensor histidine kinase